MCKSLSQGGQRCAAHTRPAFQAVEARLLHAALAGDADAMAQARTDWDAAALDYAATKEGETHFSDARRAAATTGDLDAEIRYETLLRRGRDLYESNREAGEEIARKAALAAAPDVSPTLFAAIDRYSMPRGEADAYLADLVALEHNGREWAQHPDSATFTGAIRGFDARERSRLEAYENLIDPDQWTVTFNDGGGAEPITDERYATLMREHLGQAKGAWVQSFNGYHQIVTRVSLHQARRALHHRVAGEATFAAAIEANDPELGEAAISHPACPPSVLARQVGLWHHREQVLANPNLLDDFEPRPGPEPRAKEKMTDAAWENARIKRNQSLELACTLARYDPNPAERLAAVMEVTAQPPQDLKKFTAKMLASDLDTLPVTDSYDGPAAMATHLGTFLAARTDLPRRERAEIAAALSTSPAGRKHLIETGMLVESVPVGVSGWLRRDSTPTRWATVTIDDATYEVDTKNGWLDLEV